MTGLLTRRNFVAGAAVTAGTLSCGSAFGRSAAHVTVVGGGFGGVSVARALRRCDPTVRVTLIEPKKQFVTCPYSNTVLAGLRNLNQITFDYAGLRQAGVEVLHASVDDVDLQARRVHVSGGRTLGYDRLVLAPGIDLVWNAIEGYDAAAAERLPHAWQAGPQTLFLRRQLEEMRDGGVFVMAVPADPYRCPPGPYERASLIAHYFKQVKPRSKILILDAKDTFSKRPLFEEAWRRLYPGMIEWVPGSQSGRVQRVDAGARTLHTDFDEHRADVANVIPPQRAGALAVKLGLDEGKGLCSVDPRTFESRVAPGVHVVGDAIIAGAMPKSAFSANSQAKVCARAVTALLRESEVEDPTLINTCYSLIAPDYAISIAGVYHAGPETLDLVKGSGGTSPLGASPGVHAAEAKYADSWYRNTTAELFG